MDNVFKGLPLEIVIWGNLLISIVGYIFIRGAPVIERNKRLKQFYSLFWASLILYYFTRILIGNLGLMRDRRMSAFLNPHLFNDFSISADHWAWILLVILADLSILMLCLGHFYHNKEERKYPKIAGASILIVFAIVWIFDFILGNNVLSNTIAFIVFFYTAWSCRINHISSSILWVIYAFVHLPIGIAMQVPIEWRHSIFVVLLGSKLSLIGAIYNVLVSCQSSSVG